jgi:hypothetical protein
VISPPPNPLELEVPFINPGYRQPLISKKVKQLFEAGSKSHANNDASVLSQQSKRSSKQRRLKDSVPNKEIMSPKPLSMLKHSVACQSMLKTGTNNLNPRDSTKIIIGLVPSEHEMGQL